MVFGEASQRFLQKIRPCFKNHHGVTSTTTNFLFPLSHSKENIPRRAAEQLRRSRALGA